MILGKMLPTSSKRAIWIASGFGPTNKLGYSYNGINWTAIDLSAFPIWVKSIDFDGSLFVAVGQGVNCMIYSYDGINWINNTSMLYKSSTSIKWNGSYWLALEQYGNIHKSFNGIDWAYCGYVGAYLYSLAWNGNHWLLGTSYTNGANLYSSTNGESWTSVPSFNTGDILMIAYAGSNWIAGGDQGYNIGSSSDLITWSSDYSPVPTLRGFAWNGTFGVLVGRAALYDPKNSIFKYNAIYNYTNGSTMFSSDGYSVAWNGQMFVAVGGTTNTIIYSSDGINWSLATNLFLDTWGGGYCIFSSVAPNLYPPR